jgi:small subunit ribosomal protein S1
LGGVDGLLHITDISWQRVNHPSEKLTIGDKIKVKVLNFDKEKMRVSLGLKQLTASPWDSISERLPMGKKVSGVVSNLTDYGAFVRVEEGVEGLVHVSEMDWTNANTRPSKFVKLGQEVEVVILDVQESKHRISLSMKQAQENPWEAFETNHSKGGKINVTIKSITDFGLFVGLPGGIDGLIHLADISWNKLSADQIVSSYSKGQELDVVILNIDAEKERVSLGIKQLGEDGFSQFAGANKKGSIVKGTIAEVDARGAVVELADDVSGYLKASEISQDRVEDASSLLKKGEEIEAVITQIDKRARKLSLSIKIKDSVEEKEAMKDYNKQSSTSNGSKLGDLLKEAKDK